jgi:hypothetical protein
MAPACTWWLDFSVNYTSAICVGVFGAEKTLGSLVPREVCSGC